MLKDVKAHLAKVHLLLCLTSVSLKDVSSASYPQCHIMGQLTACPKNEETVDPNSTVPFNCSIKGGGTSNQNTTWKQVYDLETPKKCLVLKTGNSETRIYLARELEIEVSSYYVEISENKGKNLSCEFTGRPRPQIVWDKVNNSTAIKAVITERETQQEDILITTSTLSIPGRSEFKGFYTCSATSRLDSGWSSTKQDTIEVEFLCPTGKIEAKGSRHVETNAFENISISCFVNEQAELGCDAFVWHFKNKTLKTDGKYRITKFEDIGDYCKKELKLEIINATENDEGDYRCQQSKCLPETWDSSDIIEINVRPPPENEPCSSHSNCTELTAVIAGDAKGSKKWMIPVTISCCGVFILLILFFVLFVKKRKAYKSIKHNMGDVVENEKVFISYSSKDFSWVTENLISPLEKHSIPYSIHNRDFELGRPIVQNMADSVFNSRQVLIVLSNNYLASNFCREELKMALQRGLDKRDSSVTLVTIDKLKKTHLPSELRKKNLLDFEKHQRRQDWEKKLIKTVNWSELVSA
ncbi:uncharacterized protein LOC114952170 isoform X3 [Acropora millepora]|uniref:uncharacterized protein LOC114952170 isoform X3 n=1 Tax=Acropora millepora TaxID=45264 RepID=UPI001CF0EFBA|nr:uncharacterized protein LOC114952170 isoform X3 [Acropora millepora]